MQRQAQQFDTLVDNQQEDVVSKRTDLKVIKLLKLIQRKMATRGTKKIKTLNSKVEVSTQVSTIVEININYMSILDFE